MKWAFYFFLWLGTFAQAEHRDSNGIRPHCSQQEYVQLLGYLKRIKAQSLSSVEKTKLYGLLNRIPRACLTGDIKEDLREGFERFGLLPCDLREIQKRVGKLPKVIFRGLQHDGCSKCAQLIDKDKERARAGDTWLLHEGILTGVGKGSVLGIGDRFRRETIRRIFDIEGVPDKLESQKMFRSLRRLLTDPLRREKQNIPPIAIFEHYINKRNQLTAYAYFRSVIIDWRDPSFVRALGRHYCDYAEKGLDFVFFLGLLHLPGTYSLGREMMDRSFGKDVVFEVDRSVLSHEEHEFKRSKAEVMVRDFVRNPEKGQRPAVVKKISDVLPFFYRAAFSISDLRRMPGPELDELLVLAPKIKESSLEDLPQWIAKFNATPFKNRQTALYNLIHLLDEPEGFGAKVEVSRAKQFIDNLEKAKKLKDAQVAWVLLTRGGHRSLSKRIPFESSLKELYSIREPGNQPLSSPNTLKLPSLPRARPIPRVSLTLGKPSLEKPEAQWLDKLSEEARSHFVRSLSRYLEKSYQDPHKALLYFILSYQGEDPLFDQIPYDPKAADQLIQKLHRAGKKKEAKLAWYLLTPESAWLVDRTPHLFKTSLEALYQNGRPGTKRPLLRRPRPILNPNPIELDP